MGDAALDRQARHRGLREVMAAGAELLAPDRANHLERGGHSASCPDTSSPSLAWRCRSSGSSNRCQAHVFAQQVRRQRLLRGRCRRRPCLCQTRGHGEHRRRHARPSDPPVRSRAVDLPVQLSDLRPNCIRLSLSICALSCSISISPARQTPAPTRASISKALSASMSCGSGAHGSCAGVYVPRCRLQHRQRCRSTRLPPIDAFEQHRQLRMGQMDLAAISLRPDQPPLFQPFRKEPAHPP